MNKSLFILLGILASSFSFAQSNPVVTAWLQNTTFMGSHYISGNPTVIQDNFLANVQLLQYSDDWVYVSTNGIPGYPTGSFLDGNPSLATGQNAIFRRVKSAKIAQGSTNWHFDVETLYNGTYILELSNARSKRSSTVIVHK